MHVLYSGYVIVVATLATIGFAKGSKDSQVTIDVKHLPSDCGYKVKRGDRVHVHYTGKLSTGAIFDSSVQANRDPLPFVLGAGQVIPGWEIGIEGMCVGEKRDLKIPPHLAYGPKGVEPVIPPDATLYFETELVRYEEGGGSSSIDLEWALNAVRFWSVPGIALYVMYKIYQRYNEATSKKPEKQSKKARRR